MQRRAGIRMREPRAARGVAEVTDTVVKQAVRGAECDLGKCLSDKVDHRYEPASGAKLNRNRALGRHRRELLSETRPYTTCLIRHRLPRMQYHADRVASAHCTLRRSGCGGQGRAGDHGSGAFTSTWAVTGSAGGAQAQRAYRSPVERRVTAWHAWSDDSV